MWRNQGFFLFCENLKNVQRTGQKVNKRLKKKRYSAPNASPAIPHHKMGWRLQKGLKCTNLRLIGHEATSSVSSISSSMSLKVLATFLPTTEKRLLWFLLWFSWSWWSTPTCTSPHKFQNLVNQNDRKCNSQN